ncbi:MAG: hypothetical protein O3B73_11050 [bacterium]|jgi:hypothetical protein|nr:hypothetical protein [bacterium]
MRWMCVLVLCSLAMGCETTYTRKTYTYYELVHSPGQLKVGDRVKIVTNDNVEIEGSIIRMSDDGLVISHEGQGSQRLWWQDVHSMLKVKTTVTEKE